jgi:hypothetical protein
MATTKRLAVITLTAAAAAAGLAGCANPLHHAASTSTASAAASATKQAAVTAADAAQLSCSGQAAWNAQAKASLRALYADTGALAADARAGNLPGVRKAGRQLASDAVAAATLPLPPVDPAAWKTLTAAYAAAGTALAGGGAITAVPQLETGGSAISAFTAAVAKCAAAKS